MPLSATHANQVWCLDFCHDACLNGTRLKVLAVKDEYTRECLALEVATGLDSHRVRQILQSLVEEREAPEYLRSDNGPEFIARHLSIWLTSQGSSSHFIKPGSPWQNGHPPRGHPRASWPACGQNAWMPRSSSIWPMPS